MGVRTVGELRELLTDEPDYRPIVLEQYVGGDLLTDETDLESVEHRTSGSVGPYVVLMPGPDVYDVCELVDEALAARERRTEQAHQLAGVLARRGRRPWSWETTTEELWRHSLRGR